MGRACQVVNPRQPSLCSDLSIYRADLSHGPFTSEESRHYWLKKKTSEFPKLGRVTRLLVTVPAYAIAQEGQFSELKRRNSGLRTSTKIWSLE